MQFRQRLLLLSALFFLSISKETVAQTIIGKPGKMGLSGPNGKTLLEPVYDSIYALDSKLFAFTQQKLKGIYNTTDSVLLQPQFNEIIPTVYGIMLKTGKLYGYIIHHGDRYEYEMPKYESVRFESSSIFLCKDSRCGAITFERPHDTLISFVFPAPIYLEAEHTVRYYSPGGKNVYARFDSESQRWNIIGGDHSDVYFESGMIIEANDSNDSLICFSTQNGKRLGSIAGAAHSYISLNRKSGEDKSSPRYFFGRSTSEQFIYDPYSGCIFHYAQHNNIFSFSIINPLNGTTIAKLESNEFRVYDAQSLAKPGSFVLSSSIETKRRIRKTTYGQSQQFVFTPFSKPQTEISIKPLRLPSSRKSGSDSRIIRVISHD